MFGNLSLGESLLQISDSKLHDITRVTPMPIDGASPRPVGLFEHEDDMPEVYDYKYAGDNGDHLLLLWNYQDDDKDMTVKLGEDSAFGGIGLDPDKTYEIWDFWDWRYVGRFQGSDTLVQRVRRNEMKTLAVREVRTPLIFSPPTGMCSREPWMPMTSPRRATRLPAPSTWSRETPTRRSLLWGITV